MSSVRNSWPAIVDALRSDRKAFLAETLGDVEVESVEADAIVLKPKGGNPMTAESIGRSRAAIQAAAGRVLGAAVQIAVSGEPREAPAASRQSAQRLSAQGANAERAKALRGKDPALDRAMDAMDLELLE